MRLRKPLQREQLSVLTNSKLIGWGAQSRGNIYNLQTDQDSHPIKYEAIIESGPYNINMLWKEKP